MATVASRAWEGVAELRSELWPQLERCPKFWRKLIYGPEWFAVSRVWRSSAPKGNAVKDISTSWEGEAPAEPQALFESHQTIRFGRSLTLPSTRITNWTRLPQISREKILHGVAQRGELGQPRASPWVHSVNWIRALKGRASPIQS